MRAEARCRHASHDPTAVPERCDRAAAKLVLIPLTCPPPSVLQTQLESNAVVTLVDSHARDNRAQTGGAIHVSGNATLRVEHSSLVDNSAAESGGAIQVCLPDAQQHAN